MDGLRSEVSQKIKDAIKAKLVELGVPVDEALPDYVMMLVVNRKSREQMEENLSLFLMEHSSAFVGWLQDVLLRLQSLSMQAKTPKSRSSKAAPPPVVRPESPDVAEPASPQVAEGAPVVSGPEITEPEGTELERTVPEKDQPEKAEHDRIEPEVTEPEINEHEAPAPVDEQETEAHDNQSSPARVEEPTRQPEPVSPTKENSPSLQPGEPSSPLEDVEQPDANMFAEGDNADEEPSKASSYDGADGEDSQASSKDSEANPQDRTGPSGSTTIKAKGALQSSEDGADEDDPVNARDSTERPHSANGRSEPYDPCSPLSEEEHLSGAYNSPRADLNSGNQGQEHQRDNKSLKEEPSMLLTGVPAEPQSEAIPIEAPVVKQRKKSRWETSSESESDGGQMANGDVARGTRDGRQSSYDADNQARKRNIPRENETGESERAAPTKEKSKQLPAKKSSSTTNENTAPKKNASSELDPDSSRMPYSGRLDSKSTKRQNKRDKKSLKGEPSNKLGTEELTPGKDEIKYSMESPLCKAKEKSAKKPDGDKPTEMDTNRYPVSKWNRDRSSSSDDGSERKRSQKRSNRSPSKSPKRNHTSSSNKVKRKESIHSPERKDKRKLSNQGPEEGRRASKRSSVSPENKRRRNRSPEGLRKRRLSSRSPEGLRKRRSRSRSRGNNYSVRRSSISPANKRKPECASRPAAAKPPQKRSSDLKSRSRSSSSSSSSNSSGDESSGSLQWCEKTPPPTMAAPSARWSVNAPNGKQSTTPQKTLVNTKTPEKEEKEEVESKKVESKDERRSPDTAHRRTEDKGKKELADKSLERRDRRSPVKSWREERAERARREEEAERAVREAVLCADRSVSRHPRITFASDRTCSYRDGEREERPPRRPSASGGPTINLREESFPRRRRSTSRSLSPRRRRSPSPRRRRSPSPRRRQSRSPSPRRRRSRSPSPRIRRSRSPSPRRRRSQSRSPWQRKSRSPAWRRMQYHWRKSMSPPRYYSRKRSNSQTQGDAQRSSTSTTRRQTPDNTEKASSPAARRQTRHDARESSPTARRQTRREARDSSSPTARREARESSSPTARRQTRRGSRESSSPNARRQARRATRESSSPTARLQTRRDARKSSSPTARRQTRRKARESSSSTARRQARESSSPSTARRGSKREAQKSPTPAARRETQSEVHKMSTASLRRRGSSSDSGSSEEDTTGRVNSTVRVTDRPQRPSHLLPKPSILVKAMEDASKSTNEAKRLSSPETRKPQKELFTRDLRSTRGSPAPEACSDQKSAPGSVKSRLGSKPQASSDRQRRSES